MSYEISILEQESSNSNTVKQHQSQQNMIFYHKDKMEANKDRSNGKKPLKMNWFGRWYSLWRYGYPLDMNTIKDEKSKPVNIPTIEYWNFHWQIEDYA
mmetsp:Transcript_14688/g.13185  ORF Transcript_14688/g.13185 Transcript_14688/m.13185 type:complete len:98 (-) Transcript_14688:89-382(-)